MAWRGRRGSSEVNAGLLAASDTFPGIRARVDLGVGARHGQLVLVLPDLGDVTTISGSRLLAGSTVREAVSAYMCRSTTCSRHIDMSFSDHN